jgi:transposase
VVDALDLSLFDAHYRNDEVDASAHAPAMLLKAVLLAYSQGMISSRAIERARKKCQGEFQSPAETGSGSLIV